jgi:hypothetical protein
MKTTILSLAAIAFVFFAFNADALAQAKAKAPKDKVLAGKIYTVEMAETTGKKVGKKANDEIGFKSEKLNSKFMTTENHFPAALYTVTVDSSSTPATISFVSEGKNSDGEDIKWEGTITGDDIEGTAIITKKGKTKKEYAYTGSIKTKGKK